MRSAVEERVTIQCNVHFKKTTHGRKRLERGAAPVETDTSRIPRISRLMALAIRFDSLIRDGHVESMAELARLGFVTRARVTQIMNLLTLAPDIQEEILHLPPTLKGHDPITERHVRPLTGVPLWNRQRKMWKELRQEVTRAV